MSENPSTAPNPAAVSRTLARAGLDRAEAETTSVRGYYRYSPGFLVRGPRAAWEEGLTGNRNEAAVFVTCQTINDSPDAPRRPHREVIDELVPQYEAALRAAGYEIERIDSAAIGFRALRVTRSVSP